jgi:CheY-like chemotaxis protein
MSILIVDDQPAHLMLLTTFLEGAGYEVASARNGQEALSYLRRTSDLPSLILLDIAMPQVTGWDFLRAQQQEAHLAVIPVIIMTALGPLDHQKVTPSVVAFLEKPIHLAELEVLLHTYEQPQLQSRVVGK